MLKGLVAISAALLTTTMAAPVNAQSLGELDANNDDVIDRAEFHQALGDGWFDRWDRDGDAGLDATELGDGLFRLWDRDDDGSLSIDEWDRTADLWFGEAAVNLSVSEWDANGDGSISREEFVSAVAETDLFARLEADDDEDELIGEDEFAKGIFDVADVDEDTFLGEDEDWFVTDLIEMFNAPGDEDPALNEGEVDAGADPVDADVGVGAVDEPDDLVVLDETFVGLPIPCEAEDSGCRQTAQRFCSVLGFGEPIGFFDSGGQLYAVRCANNI